MGQLTFPDAARVYIDTVTVIYAVEQAPTYGNLLNSLWSNLQTGNLKVVTSELNIATATTSGCTQFLTNDRQLPTGSISLRRISSSRSETFC
jgi:hypothetical protein